MIDNLLRACVFQPPFPGIDSASWKEKLNAVKETYVGMELNYSQSGGRVIVKD